MDQSLPRQALEEQLCALCNIYQSKYAISSMAQVFESTAGKHVGWLSKVVHGFSFQADALRQARHAKTIQIHVLSKRVTALNAQIP